HRKIDDPTLDASVERLRRGEVGLVVLSIVVPDAVTAPPGAVRAGYESTRSTVLAALAAPAASGTFSLPGAPPAQGPVRPLFAFEGAAGSAARPDDVGAWIRRGACLFGLVHQTSNALAGSSQDPDPARRALGLSEAGRVLVAAVYRHGGLVDVAH